MATMHGEVVGRTFDDAVRTVIGDRPLLEQGVDGRWTYWGCRLFDNEADARRSFWLTNYAKSCATLLQCL